MGFLSYLRVEIRRAFLLPNTWLVMLLTLCAPLIGLVFYKPATQLAVTSSGTFIGNPTLAGAVVGALLFALLTLYELDRVHKNGIDKLTGTVVSPLTMHLTKIISLLAAATLAGVLATVIYLPYTIIKVGYVFDWSTYWGSWFIIFLPALWIGCLMAAVFYQITRHVDFSFVLILAAAVLCFLPFSHYEFILRWINPDVPFLSDMFGNSQPLRMAAYNRVFWLTALSGLYIISLLCVRKYGKGLLGSFRINGRSLYKPAMGAALVLLAVQLYTVQPFVSTAPPGYDPSLMGMLRIHRGSDLAPGLYTSSYARVVPDLKNGTINATTTWKFWNLFYPYTPPGYDEHSIFNMCMQINSGLNVRSITSNGTPLEFTELPDRYMDFKLVSFIIPYARSIDLVVEYDGYLNIWRENEKSGLFGSVVSPQYLYFAAGNSDGGTSGFMDKLGDVPPNFGAGWGTSTASRANENTFDIVLPDNFMLINYYRSLSLLTGDTVGIISKPRVVHDNDDGTKTWRFLTAGVPVTAIYAADYVYETIAIGEMNIDFYYARKNQEVMEKYNVLESLKEVYDYCASKIAPRPPSNIVFIQSLDAKEPEFSEAMLSKQGESASGQETMSYRVIRQWWQDIQFTSTRSSSAELTEWNIDTVVEYIAYRMASEKFGKEFATANYVDVWKDKVSDINRNFYTRNPEYRLFLPQMHANLFTLKEQEVLYYYTMPLKILKAAELVGGEEKMDDIFAALYKKAYNEQQAREVPESRRNYEEFLELLEIEKPQGVTNQYFAWLYDMAYGREAIPQYSDIPPIEHIFRECDLKDVDLTTMRSYNPYKRPIEVWIYLLHEQIMRLFDDAVPLLAYSDFLEVCGVSAEDLELTEHDWMIGR